MPFIDELPADAMTEVDAQRLAGLPFVQVTEDGPRFWCVEPTGHDQTDFSIGETFGLLALAVAKEGASPISLALILADIVEGGKITGLEAGFLATVASAARSGSMQ